MFSPSVPCSHIPPGRGRKIWEAAAARPRGRCADLRPRPRRSRRPAWERPQIPGAQRRRRARVDGGGGGGREGRPGAIPERLSVRALGSALGKPGRSRRRCYDPGVQYRASSGAQYLDRYITSLASALTANVTGEAQTGKK